MLVDETITFRSRVLFPYILTQKSVSRLFVDAILIHIQLMFPRIFDFWILTNILYSREVRVIVQLRHGYREADIRVSLCDRIGLLTFEQYSRPATTMNNSFNSQVLLHPSS